MNWHRFARASRSVWRGLCSKAGDNSGSEKITRPTYTAASAESLGRVWGPDRHVTPISRKELPYITRSRNAAGPYEAPGIPVPNYPKRKSPHKRAKALLNALSKEEGLRMIRDGRATFAEKLPRPLPGQILRVCYVSNASPDPPKQYFAGIVIAVRQRYLGSTVILRSVVEGVAVERAFPLYSPRVKDVQVIGQKRTKRSKLYYLRDKPLRDSAVANATSKPRS